MATTIDTGALATEFAGLLLQPSDTGYEEARRVHNGLVDKHPALIARCAGTADIADAVKLARTLNLEVAVRYSRVWFHGIDPTLIDPTAFATPVDVPVDREQWTFGMNYYFYPSMALRLAYEINHELNGINLHDNVFLGQFVWAF